MDRVAARNGRPRTSWPTLWCCAVASAVPWAFLSLVASEACPQSPGVPCGPGSLVYLAMPASKSSGSQMLLVITSKYVKKTPPALATVGKGAPSAHQ